MNFAQSFVLYFSQICLVLVTSIKSFDIQCLVSTVHIVQVISITIHVYSTSKLVKAIGC